jgi:hypothetical protein
MHSEAKFIDPGREGYSRLLHRVCRLHPPREELRIWPLAENVENASAAPSNGIGASATGQALLYSVRICMEE